MNLSSATIKELWRWAMDKDLHPRHIENAARYYHERGFNNGYWSPDLKLRYELLTEAAAMRRAK